MFGKRNFGKGVLGMKLNLFCLIMLLGSLFVCSGQKDKLKVYWTDTPPALDGKMDEACWQEAEVIDNFKGVGIRNVSFASTEPQQTEVRFTYDGRNLYVFWKLYEKDMPKVVMGKPEVKRDQFSRQIKRKWVDATELQLYPGRSEMNFLMFISSPLGARYDLASLGTWSDYNPDWKSVPGKFKGGWTLEQRIPFAELAQKGKGFVTPSVGDEWRIQMYRKKFDPPEVSKWGAGEPPPPDYANCTFCGRKSGKSLPVISRKKTDIFYGANVLDFNISGAPIPLEGTSKIFCDGHKVSEGKSILKQTNGNLSIPFKLRKTGKYQVRFELSNNDEVYFSGMEIVQLAPIKDLIPQVSDSQIKSAEKVLSENKHPIFPKLKKQLAEFSRIKHGIEKQLSHTAELSDAEWHQLATNRKQMINLWKTLKRDLNLARIYPGKRAAPVKKFAVGAVTESDKIYPDTEYQGLLTEPIQLSLAGNEYGSFQLVIIPFWTDLQDVSVSFSSLIGPDGKKIPADNIFWFREGYVKLGQPRAWLHLEYEHDREPDQLLPAKPFNVKQGTVKAVWVDVLMPEGMPEGGYTGTASVTANGQTVQRKLKVHCYGFDIPKVSSLENEYWWTPSNWQKFYGYSMKYTPELHAKHAAVLGRYRVSSFPCDWQTLCKQVPIYAEKDGSFTFDWTTFDKYVKNALDNGTTAFWSALSCNSGWTVYLHNPKAKVIERATGKTVPLKKYLPPGIKNHWDLSSIPYRENRVYRDFLKAYVKHLKELGINDRAYYELFDEPGGNRFLTMLKHHKFFRETVPDLKLMNFNVYPTANADGKTAVGLIDTWAPDLHLLDDPEVLASMYERRDKHGEKLWAYTCVELRRDKDGKTAHNSAHTEENYSPFAVYHRPYIALRIQQWMAWKYKLDGFYIFMLSAVPKPNCGKKPEERWPATEWSDGQQMGSGTLVYPGPHYELIPGIRLANIREGLEDYEYFALLKSLAGKLDKTRHKDLLARVNKALEMDMDIVSSVFDWTKDRNRLEAKRNQLAALINEVKTVLK